MMQIVFKILCVIFIVAVAGWFQEYIYGLCKRMMKEGKND